MKSFFYIFLFIASNFTANFNSTQVTGELKLKIKNVNVENKGKIYLALFTKENFMTQNFYQSTIHEVGEEYSFEITFKDVPFGVYAVSAFHDINGNQQMDFNENGMPVEDYAMSGTPNEMGPPRWEEVKFTYHEDTTMINVNF
ncbi:DUF2141 domain-containing protein [Psychroflexus salis]|uniref:DUF2141 domain-containing protein n=1 Tax=Psychroflexus salis TaxID=1526574 RepID=A0A917A0G0_9FLAO|nr:DUF2141 domain-containing protein [Psychroflexus salis]GGE19952.1 hypothetical protein GCM10010831_21350 [Psychroflexus salis]